MIIENLVISYEISKKLYELGVKQDSFYYWEIGCSEFSDNGEPVIINSHFHNKITGEWGDCHLYHKNEIYSAFLSSELGDILPNCITTKYGSPFNNYRIAISKFISIKDGKQNNNYIVNYECDSTLMSGEEAWLRKKLISTIYDPNLSNAMAKMLIHLIESNLVKIVDINKNV